MNAADRFLMNHAEMDPSELMLWLDDAATLQDAHPKISVEKDNWVPGASRFREHKETISKELEKAAALNLATTKELAAALAAAVEDVNINGNYIILRAKHEKDDIWLRNNGYTAKDKAKGKKLQSRAVAAVALLLRLKNGPDIGDVTASWHKDPGAGSYQLQICKGEPQGEESWVDHGYFKKVRTVISGLERACWYYFRVRSVGNNETGRWSEPVGIIVT